MHILDDVEWVVLSRGVLLNLNRPEGLLINDDDGDEIFEKFGNTEMQTFN